jgi:tripartite-type tricarboxylate transporter receptor subunit TctC
VRKNPISRYPSLLHCLTASLLLALLTALPASAQTHTDFPTRPVRWLVGFAPGASNDIIARIVAARLSENFNQQVIVDNRAGAGGMIAGEIVAKGTPDGHTVLLSTGGPSTIGPLLTKRAPYRVDEFSQVIMIGYTPLVIVAHPAFPPRNAAELIAYARAHPGKINWGSSGTGGSPHYGLLILQSATGIDVTHVPFKGSAPSLVAIAAGQIQAMHSSVVSAEALLNGKRVKVIASASKKRLAALPDVPTFAEMGFPNAESQVWFGMAAPPRTPRAVVGKLNAEVNRILQNADSVRRLRDLGLEILGGSPDDATQFVKREAQMVAKFIEQGRLKPD